MRDTVLVVEDDPAHGRALVRLLRTLIGVEATLVGNGRDAIAALRALPDRFFLALVDHGLPDIDGCTVAKSIASIEPSVRCVMMTGQGDAGGISHLAVEATDGRFVLKPFGLDELRTLVDSARSSTPEARIDAAVSALATAKKLSDAEEHLVRVAAHGLAREALASHLKVNESTVRSRIAAILDKWGGANIGPLPTNAPLDRSRRARTRAARRAAALRRIAPLRDRHERAVAAALRESRRAI